MTSRQEDVAYMQQAVDLSRQKSVVEHGTGTEPFSAVVVKEGKVIATGWNQMAALHDPTCHGEVNAIRNACAQLKTMKLEGCILYSSCEPCGMCACAIALAGINKVYYANTLSNIVHMGVDPTQYSGLAREMALPPSERRRVLFEHVAECEASAKQVFLDWAKVNHKE